jgi:hypothetical protein
MEHAATPVELFQIVISENIRKKKMLRLFFSASQPPPAPSSVNFVRQIRFGLRREPSSTWHCHLLYIIVNNLLRF